MKLDILSQLPVLDSTKSTPKKIIHTPSLNPQSVLWMRIFETQRKRKLRMNYQLRFRRNFQSLKV